MTKWSEVRGRTRRGPACPRCGEPISVLSVLRAVFERWGPPDVLCDRCRTTARMTWQSRLATHGAATTAMMALVAVASDHLPSATIAVLALASYVGVAAACTPLQRWRPIAGDP